MNRETKDVSPDSATRRQMLRGLLAATTAVAAAVVASCLLVAALDLLERGEDWDGFAAFLALLVGIPTAVVGVLAMVAFRSVRRDLTRARWLGAVVGGLLLLPGVATPGALVAYLPLLLGVALIGAAAIAGPSTGQG